jgi:transposase InsO family protein
MKFNFDIIHRPGRLNVVADALSRPADNDTPSILLQNMTTEQMVLEEVKGRKVPDPAIRDELIKNAHAAGHLGIQGTIYKIYHDGYYWAGMRKDVERILNTCVPCQKYTIVREGFHPLSTISANAPWEHIAIDLITPMPTNKQKLTSLLVITDIFSKFVVLKALRSKSATEVAAALWETIALFGPPKIIQSDNGTEFVNSVIKSLVSAHGIDHRLVSPYNPRANGAAERTNGVFLNMMRKCLNGIPQDWVTWLPFVQFSINAYVTRSHGSTPFAVMFGRSLNNFVDFTEITNDQAPTESLRAWKARQDDLHKVIYPALAERHKNRQEKMQETFDGRKRTIEFEPGDYVMVKDPTRASKWDPVYEGPCTVIRKTRGGSYILEDRNGTILSSRFAPSQLKRTAVTEKDETNENIFEAIKIVDHRGTPNNYEFLVAWKHTPQRTWEPQQNILSNRLLKKYWKSKEMRRFQAGGDDVVNQDDSC